MGMEMEMEERIDARLTPNLWARQRVKMTQPMPPATSSTSMTMMTTPAVFMAGSSLRGRLYH